MGCKVSKELAPATVAQQEHVKSSSRDNDDVQHEADLTTHGKRLPPSSTIASTRQRFSLSPKQVSMDVSVTKTEDDDADEKDSASSGDVVAPATKYRDVVFVPDATTTITNTSNPDGVCENSEKKQQQQQQQQQRDYDLVDSNIDSAQTKNSSSHSSTAGKMSKVEPTQTLEQSEPQQDVVNLESEIHEKDQENVVVDNQLFQQQRTTNDYDEDSYDLSIVTNKIALVDFEKLIPRQVVKVTQERKYNNEVHGRRLADRKMLNWLRKFDQSFPDRKMVDWLNKFATAPPAPPEQQQGTTTTTTVSDSLALAFSSSTATPVETTSSAQETATTQKQTDATTTTSIDLESESDHNKCLNGHDDSLPQSPDENGDDNDSQSEVVVVTNTPTDNSVEESLPLHPQPPVTEQQAGIEHDDDTSADSFEDKSNYSLPLHPAAPAEQTTASIEHDKEQQQDESLTTEMPATLLHSLLNIHGLLEQILETNELESSEVPYDDDDDEEVEIVECETDAEESECSSSCRGYKPQYLQQQQQQPPSLLGGPSSTLGEKSLRPILSNNKSMDKELKEAANLSQISLQTKSTDETSLDGGNSRKVERKGSEGNATSACSVSGLNDLPSKRSLLLSVGETWSSDSLSTMTDANSDRLSSSDSVGQARHNNSNNHDHDDDDDNNLPPLSSFLDVDGEASEDENEGSSVFFSSSSSSSSSSNSSSCSASSFADVSHSQSLHSAYSEYNNSNNHQDKYLLPRDDDGDYSTSSDDDSSSEGTFELPRDDEGLEGSLVNSSHESTSNFCEGDETGRSRSNDSEGEESRDASSSSSENLLQRRNMDLNYDRTMFESRNHAPSKAKEKQRWNEKNADSMDANPYGYGDDAEVQKHKDDNPYGYGDDAEVQKHKDDNPYGYGDDTEEPSEMDDDNPYGYGDDAEEEDRFGDRMMPAVPPRSLMLSREKRPVRRASLGIQINASQDPSSRSLLLTREPSSRLLFNREPSNKLLFNTEPSSKLSATREPSSRLLFNKEPSSKLLFNQEPSSKLLFNKEPSSKLLVHREPSSRLLFNREPSSRLLITREPSSRLLLTIEQPAIRRASLGGGNVEQEATMQFNQNLMVPPSPQDQEESTTSVTGSRPSRRRLSLDFFGISMDQSLSAKSLHSQKKRNEKTLDSKADTTLFAPLKRITKRFPGGGSRARGGNKAGENRKTVGTPRGSKKSRNKKGKEGHPVSPTLSQSSRTDDPTAGQQGSTFPMKRVNTRLNARHNLVKAVVKLDYDNMDLSEISCDGDRFDKSVEVKTKKIRPKRRRMSLTWNGKGMSSSGSKCSTESDVGNEASRGPSERPRRRRPSNRGGGSEGLPEAEVGDLGEQIHQRRTRPMDWKGASCNAVINEEESVVRERAPRRRSLDWLGISHDCTESDARPKPSEASQRRRRSMDLAGGSCDTAVNEEQSVVRERAPRRRSMDWLGISTHGTESDARPKPLEAPSRRRRSMDWTGGACDTAVNEEQSVVRERAPRRRSMDWLGISHHGTESDAKSKPSESPHGKRRSMDSNTGAGDELDVVKERAPRRRSMDWLGISHHGQTAAPQSQGPANGKPSKRATGFRVGIKNLRHRTKLGGLKIAEKMFNPSVVVPKTEAQKECITKALQCHFIFRRLLENKELVDQWIMSFEKLKCLAGDTIIRQGDTGDCFYVVYKGSCSFEIDGKPVLQKDSEAKEIAGPGRCFGELALLYSSPRAATVIAESDMVLFRVDFSTFQQTVQRQLAVSEDEKIMLLRGVSFLNALDGESVRELAKILMPRVFEKGEYLVRKGDMSKNFFVVKEGEVSVTDYGVGDGQTSEAKYEDFTMGPGDHFGERALVLNEPVEANIMAITRVVVFMIQKQFFANVIGDLKQLNTRQHDKQTLGAIKIIKDSQLGSAKLAMLANLVQDVRFEKGAEIILERKPVQAALYLVREGKIAIFSSMDASCNKTVVSGGYFGEEQLLKDLPGPHKNSTPLSRGMTKGSMSSRSSRTFSLNSTTSLSYASKNGTKDNNGPQRGVRKAKSFDAESSSIIPKYSAIALEDCVCGVLTLRDCRTVFNTKSIGKKQIISFESATQMDREVQLSQLKKHRVLGEGSFGQVWLVTRSGQGTPYALKIQSKHELLKYERVDEVVRERDIMGQLHHPFIMRLVNTYQDECFIYMLLGFVQGGELVTRYQESNFEGLPESDAIFYAACIFDALSHMHRKMIIYRDLKPENVLIDNEGYVVIADFGFAKVVEDKTFTFSGTPLYMAPEIIRNTGHGKAADHWSLGIMIYEMLAGATPFEDDNISQLELFRRICEQLAPRRADKISSVARDLICGLLQKDPRDRMGSLINGDREIREAKWFANAQIDWEMLRRKEIEAPWIPETTNILDSSNFQAVESQDKTERDYPAILEEDNRYFKDF